MSRLDIVSVRALAVTAGMVLLASAAGASPPSSQTPVSDVKVHAAFLMNVAQFVRWPETSGPLVIGVAGDEALAAVLSQTGNGRTIAGRALTVRAIAAADDPSGCDMLYIGNLNDREASALLARARGPVLTVGVTLRFLRDGGMIRIFIDSGRMKFQVNQRKAVDAGLQISSQLLSLAVQ